MIHFDTSYLIALEQPDSIPGRQFATWIARDEPMAVSAIVWTEYSCGPLSADKFHAAEILLPNKEAFLPGDAPVAARLFNETGRRRGSLVDCMLAATALRCGARLATLNKEDFQLFEGFGLTLA